MGDGSKEIGDLACKQRIILHYCMIVLKVLSKKLKEHTHCLKAQIDVYCRPFYLLIFFCFSHVSI